MSRHVELRTRAGPKVFHSPTEPSSSYQDLLSQYVLLLDAYKVSHCFIECPNFMNEHGIYRKVRNIIKNPKPILILGLKRWNLKRKRIMDYRALLLD